MERLFEEELIECTRGLFAFLKDFKNEDGDDNATNIIRNGKIEHGNLHEYTGKTHDFYLLNKLVRMFDNDGKPIDVQMDVEIMVTRNAKS